MKHKNFTNQELVSMENEIESFFKTNSIDYSVPVDSVAIATSLGFNVYALNLNEIGQNIDGIILVDENSDKKKLNKVIAFDNSIKDIKRVRFIIAHELAHYISQKNLKSSPMVFAEKLNVHGEKKTKEEQEMDYKAAAILIPKESLQNDLKARHYSALDKIGQYSVEQELADIYEVELSVLQRRIEEI